MDGWIRFLSSDKLEDLPQMKFADRPGYQVSNGLIRELLFSSKGDVLGFSDASHGVGVLRKEPVKLKQESETSVDHIKKRIEWVFIGKAKIHSKPVVGMFLGDFLSSANSITIAVALVFIPGEKDEKENRLVSVSEDRSVVEYNVDASSVRAGLIVKVSHLVLVLNLKKLVLFNENCRK